jgi:peptide/nickel transport system permease protein
LITYIIKRVLLFIPTLIAITLVTFGISKLAPGDPLELKVGLSGENQRADRVLSKASYEQLRKQWNFDKPIWYWTLFDTLKNTNGELLPNIEQITFRWNGLENQYHLWAKKALLFDFGKSIKDNKDVLPKIWERVPITLLMSIISIILSYLIAIPIGIYSATHPGSWLDRLLSTSLFALYSLPNFWVATLMFIYVCIGGGYLDWFPSSNLHSIDYSDSWSWFEKTNDLLWHLVLPMIVYTYGSFAYISRQMRTAMLEVVRQDYIRTARAKGLKEKTVIFKHALRNSLIPIITLLAGLLPGLLGGSIIVESIFTIPGIGKLAFEALTERDYPVIMAELIISAVLTMIGVLFADILYSVADPRIAFDKKSS